VGAAVGVAGAQAASTSVSATTSAGIKKGARFIRFLLLLKKGRVYAGSPPPPPMINRIGGEGKLLPAQK
jgi:predicted alpha/beta-hydrolase family hydrolase